MLLLLNTRKEGGREREGGGERKIKHFGSCRSVREREEFTFVS
jgi:hypothetical protein